MAYEQRVDTEHPALIVLLIDDSKSMLAPMEEATSSRPVGPPKHVLVEAALTEVLEELLDRSTLEYGEGLKYRNRYFVDIIRYGTAPSAWSPEPLPVHTLLNQLAEQATDPAAGGSGLLGGRLGGTDALAAYTMAKDRVQAALASKRFSQSFPPMVFHLTDGMSATDARQVAGELMQLGTSDGKVLVVNSYIGTSTDLRYNGTADFPGYTSEADIGDEADNLRLFHMSSRMPPTIYQNLRADRVFPSIRANACMFFDIRTSNMLQHVIQVMGSVGSRAFH